MGEWLESLVPWGTEVIVWGQSQSPGWLDAVFKFFTSLGYEEFYLLLLPFVFWCLHKRIGASLGYISLTSAWLNNLFKYIFAIPRPADPRLQVPLPETSPSFPSGHAQNAIVNWGYLAYRYRRWAFTVVAVVIILGISLSRIVLGVHFPQDVIGGWLIGLVLLVVFAWAEPRVSRWLSGQSSTIQAALAITVPLLLILVHPADVEGRYPAEAAVTPMSALLGLGIGLIMEQDRVRFRVEGVWWRRGLRFLAGLIVVALLYVGPRLILPEGMAYGLETLLRFLRYALLGWAVAFLCPWLFVRLRLAEGEGEEGTMG
jgi:membrane-associated phospholipid phosphatase